MSELAVKTGVLIVCLQLLIALGPVSAQTNIETNAPGIQLNFSTPGARSLALGGTFLGRADDATAAYANPAGLANLPEKEASVELRGWGFTHVFTDRGCNERCIAPFESLEDGSASDASLGLSFASFVVPGRRWAIALFVHTLADFEANFSTQGAILNESTLNPVRSRSRLKILGQGVSASYRLSTNLSMGVSLTHHQFQIDTSLKRDEFFCQREECQIGLQEQEGRDTDVSMTLGVLWRWSPQLQFGGVYRQGTRFGFHARSVETDFDGTPFLEDLVEQQAVFHVPEQWGIGALWRVTDRLNLGVDYYRVGYSAFASDFTDIFGQDEIEEFTADDGNEVHIGLEYLFPNGPRPWWLRSGVWYDPQHGIKYTGDELASKARFRDREGVLHWAAGVGTVGERHQIDVGIDYSERTLTTSVSMVVRF